jgi:hypothetical protein
MEEDRETRTDEDVEGHVSLNANLEQKDAAVAREDDDDVEGHVTLNANLESKDAAVAREDDDDVEGHVHSGA